MTLASCIMPTADRPSFVPGAVALFLAQDYENAELVILDDGEQSVEHLIPRHDKIRYLRTQPHPCLGAKRNAAVEAARGGIILHWDDDDWYAPHRIRAQVEALQRTDADLCGLDRAFFINPAQNAAWQYVYPPGGAPWVYGATFCYRKDFWAKKPFPKLHVGEDTSFAAAVPPGRLHRLADQRIYVALIHPRNTSRKHTQDPRWQPYDIAALKSFIGPGWPDQPSAPAPPCPAREPALSALVAAASGIGDILRVTPLIRALHLLGNEVDVLLAPDNPEAAELLRGAPEIRRLFVTASTMQGHVPKLPEALTARRYHLAAFSSWSRSLAPQITAGQIRSFEQASWLREGDTACILKIARQAGWQGALPPPFAQRGSRQFNLPPGTIALHPGCKPDWPWKRWHGFAELAAVLPHVVIIGTASDRDNSGTYFNQPHAWPAHARDYTGQLSLLDTAALLAECSALIANDSGPMHLGVALGIPTLGIFGITSPAREAMAAPNMHVLTKQLPCEPACRAQAWGRRDCAHHLACLKTLTPAEVLARLHHLLAGAASAITDPAIIAEEHVPMFDAAGPETIKPLARRTETLTLAVRMEGGLGDVLLAARLVEAVYHALDHCDIDVFYHTPDAARFVFHQSPIVRGFHHDAAPGRPNHTYDLILYTQHYAHFAIQNPSKLEKICPEACGWLQRAGERFAAYRGLYERRPQLDGLWGRISGRHGRNVLDNLGFMSGLNVNRATELALSPDLAAHANLKSLLRGIAGRYITVHDGFDNTANIAPGRATKCWPIESWRRLVELLHAQSPDFKIIQLGSAKSRSIPGVDGNLVARTNLHQTAWILKNATLHIDTDSGLVHLARAVHTASIALHGPTNPAFYGYQENLNLRAGDCAECWWSTPDWLARCPRGLPAPACMEAISPAEVASQARAYLEKTVAPSATFIKAQLYHGGLLRTEAATLTDIFRHAGLAPVPVSAHARNEETGIYLHASKQWEYLFALGAIGGKTEKLRILDAGGGRGALPAHLARRGHDVHVIDQNFLHDHGGDEDVERRYMRSGPALGLNIRYGSLYNLPAASASFDIVTCISAIEHLPSQSLVLHELLRVLRPGGTLILTFDFAAEPGPFEDQLRLKIFSPQRLQDVLAEIGAATSVFTADEARASAAAIAQDGVLGIPAGMTVGGLAVRKNLGKP